MAFSEHWRLSIGGRITASGLPDEIWNCNVSASGTSTTPQDDLEERRSNFESWWTSESFPNNATLDYAKLNLIGPTGKYVSSTTTNVITLAGNAGSIAPSTQSILCVSCSWYTDKARGPGSKGRIYLPNWTIPSATSMIVSSGLIGSVRNMGLDLLQIIHLMGANGRYTPVVASAVDGSLNPIRGVRVGNIVDVQRRRKNAYPEVYSTQVFTPTS